jgi:hypothetical protein
MANPNLELLTDAVKLLDPLLGELVFVGGCATALLITDSAAADVRPTFDVDAIAGVYPSGSADSSISADSAHFGIGVRLFGFEADRGSIFTRSLRTGRRDGKLSHLRWRRINLHRSRPDGSDSQYQLARRFPSSPVQHVAGTCSDFGRDGRVAEGLHQAYREGSEGLEYVEEDGKKLKKLLKETQRLGYALNDEELVKGLRGVASPVRDRAKTTVAAICITVPAGRATIAKLKGDFVTELLRTADQISYALGYRGKYESRDNGVPGTLVRG